MSTLEALIVQRLKADATLAALLATWAGTPAVFVDYAPQDDSARWGNADPSRPKQYGRVIVAVDQQADPSRQVDGVVRVTIDATEQDVPAVERRVRALLDGMLWTGADDTSAPAATRWRRSVASPWVPDAADISEVLADFDLILLPAYDMPTPNPTGGLRSFSETAFPDLQTDPATWADTNGAPALYWTAERVVLVREMGTKAKWWQGTFRGHVLAPRVQDRVMTAFRVAQSLSEQRAVVLADGSLLDIVRPVGVETGADPLRTGQVLVTAEYRTLVPQPPAAHPLHVVTSGDIEMEVPPNG